MDGGSDHCTNFLSVKIAIIVLYHSLNADMILHLWDAPGHSYRNPPEREKERESKLYPKPGFVWHVGLMHQKLHVELVFEDKRSQCSNLSDARKLIVENQKNAELGNSHAWIQFLL